MATCRICGKSEYEQAFDHSGDNKMIKYSTRHYAHAGCALDKWGAEFFNRLTSFQCKTFPYFSAKKRELDHELEIHCEMTHRTEYRS